MTPLAAPERDLAVLRSFIRRIDPSDAGAHNNLGVLFYQRGLPDEAVAAFTRALELDPRMTVAQRNLEIVYGETGFYDRRIAELRERLRASAEDHDARWELGRAFAAVGQTDDALNEFQELLAGAPNHLGAMLQVGLLEQRRGNLDTANEWLQRARELKVADRLETVKGLLEKKSFREALAAGMQPVVLEEHALKQLESIGWRRAVIPAGRFPHLNSDHLCLDYGGWPLYTRESLADEDVYKVCEAIHARESEIYWESSYVGIGQLGRETEATPMDVPLHPGAARWYREHGFQV